MEFFRVTGPLWGESIGDRLIPLKDQWRGALIFPLISAWTKGQTNNQDAGDLGRHRAHYDVIVMLGNITRIWKQMKLEQLVLEGTNLSQITQNLNVRWYVMGD